MSKTCDKPLCKNIRGVLGKKTIRKNNKYSRNQIIFKIDHVAQPVAHAKAMAFAKWSAWVKN